MANYRNLYRIKLGVVRVHGDVVAGDQLAALHAVIPAGVLLGDGDDDEAALAGDHVPLGGELHGVAALGFAVVVPLHLLLGDDLAKTAGQVHSLPKVGHRVNIFPNCKLLRTCPSRSWGMLSYNICHPLSRNC